MRTFYYQVTSDVSHGVFLARALRDLLLRHPLPLRLLLHEVRITNAFRQSCVDLGTDSVGERVALLFFVGSVEGAHVIFVDDSIADVRGLGGGVHGGGLWVGGGACILAFLTRAHFRSTFILLRISEERLVGLLLLILVNPLQDTVHLLLEQEFELFNHKLIDGATLDKVSDKALDCVAFIDDDPLDAKVSNIDIDVEFSLSFISRRILISSGFLRLNLASSSRAVSIESHSTVEVSRLVDHFNTIGIVDVNFVLICIEGLQLVLS